MINGERIRQAREIAGLTQDELARKIGLAQSHVALFEQNLRQPQNETLNAIAMAVGFPLAFFKQPSAPDFPLGSLLYRRRKNMSSRDRDRVRQTGRLVFEAISHMSDRFKRIDLRLPRLPNTDPHDAARITRAELGFSPDTPIINLMTRLEKNGVVIAAIPFEIEEHDAFSVWANTEPRTPVIVMTSGKPGDRQRFSVSHELGHLVMHYTYNGDIAQIEDHANAFASEFLLPEEAMRKALIPPITLTSLADLKSKWGVAMQALIMRAFDLGILTDGQRRYLFRQMAAKQWLTTEPVEIPAEKPRLLRKLGETLYGPNVSAREIAEPLGVPPSFLRPILNAYVSVSDLRAKTTIEDKPKTAHKKVVPMQFSR